MVLQHRKAKAEFDHFTAKFSKIPHRMDGGPYRYHTNTPLPLSNHTDMGMGMAMTLMGATFVGYAATTTAMSCVI
jgi:hypothetical protein